MVSFKKVKLETKKVLGIKLEQSEKTVEMVKNLYKNAYSAKSGRHSEWAEDIEAYKGDLFIQDLPDYKSQEVSNYVFSTVETIKPIMLAENPKMMAIPSTEAATEKSILVQRALEYEWSRAKMFSKLSRALTVMLSTGTVIIGLPWNEKSQNGLGNADPKIISPFNFFVDNNATDLDDAEIQMYADYISVGEAINMYPERADEIRSEITQVNDEYLTYGRDANNGAAKDVLFVDLYMKDYTMETLLETGEDNLEYNVTKMKYPRGRRIVVIGDTLISDGQNPYEDGKPPYVMLKCYDVPGEFWGCSEVKNIKSPQKHLNELTNQILDAAKLTANSPWVVDKNAGIPKGTLTNRQGLVIRKNPGTDVHREAPGSMPAYLDNIIGRLQKDMEMIPGVYDVTRGERPTGITAAAAIQALNEQAQGRIKLKVQAMEQMLGELFSMWLKRIQQFWVTKRNIYVMGADYKTQYSLVNGDDVDGDFDIFIVAGSTMPVNKVGKLQTLIQLAQTKAEDELPMVDRQTILENADVGNLQEVLARFAKIKAEAAQAQQDALAQQQNPPSASISFKDLPMSGKMQLAQQAGIQLDQSELQKQEVMQEVKDDTDLQQKHMQMDSMAKSDSLNGLQAENDALQSNQTGSKQDSNEQPDELNKVIELIASMDSKELHKFLKENPELQPIFDKIYEQLKTE